MSIEFISFVKSLEQLDFLRMRLKLINAHLITIKLIRYSVH